MGRQMTESPDFMNVGVQLSETAQPLFHRAINTYTKGPLFCVYDGIKVYKYPIIHIWRVVEEYGPHV